MDKSSNTSPKKPIDVKSLRMRKESLQFLLLHLFDHHGEHEMLEEYLKTFNVPQNILDFCLLEGLESLRRSKCKNIPYTARSLKLFLKFGAMWEPSTLLETWMIPYLNFASKKKSKRYRHMPYNTICNMPGDYQELLELVIKAVGPAWPHKKKYRFNTAIVYAVMLNNIDCVRTLLMNGARASPCFESYFKWLPNYGFKKTQHKSHSRIIRSDILNVLVSGRINVNQQYSFDELSPLMYAAATGSTESIRTLMQKKAKFDLTDCNGNTVWKWATLSGRVDVLDCLSEHGSSYEEETVLYWALRKERIEIVHYILNKESTLRNLKQGVEHGKQGEVNLMLSDVVEYHDPCIIAVTKGLLSVVQRMEEIGYDTFQTFGALIQAVLNAPYRQGSMDVLEYLLCKYNYPLNHQYHDGAKTLLTVACQSACAAESLLKHGADPNMKNCYNNGYTAIHWSITCKNTASLVACFIRSGADPNMSSYDELHGNVLPFEAAVLYHNHCAAEMLLLSGCSCGFFNTQTNLEDWNDMTPPEMRNLMNSWNVRQNRVKSLKVMSRTTILKHLSPTTAGQKLGKLPLPDSVIRYLGIPELDDVIDAGK